jgi:hypothetical protein
MCAFCLCVCVRTVFQFVITGGGVCLHGRLACSEEGLEFKFGFSQIAPRAQFDFCSLTRIDAETRLSIRVTLYMDILISLQTRGKKKHRHHRLARRERARYYVPGNPAESSFITLSAPSWVSPGSYVKLKPGFLVQKVF